jgi:predicted nucleotidyltransferase/HEPN domain-containing protein
MKTTINHLPQFKKDELQAIVSLICENCDDIEKIILFGSYARGNYKEVKDLKPNSKSDHVSDYDILVVTKKKEIALDSVLWSKISKKLRVIGFSAHPKLITHDIIELNKKLSEGQYFFSDITKEGILLFDTKKFELTHQKKLTGEEKQKIAQDHFDYWFKKSNLFFRDYNSNFKEGFKDKDFLVQASFHLHQTSESCYKAILLVFANYTPREHFLEILGKEAEKHHVDLKNVFPKFNKEDEDRFKLLEYAYVGARYDPDYYISKEDLEILSKDVEKLLKLTEEICRKRILNLCQE